MVGGGFAEGAAASEEVEQEVPEPGQTLTNVGRYAKLGSDPPSIRSMTTVLKSTISVAIKEFLNFGTTLYDVRFFTMSRKT